MSAPSGAGKTTLNRRLVAEHPEVIIATSHTTRPIRAGETDGKDYYFIDEKKFRQMVADNEMLEWAVVHDKLYGTSKSEMDRIEGNGYFALLEIDVQGWIQARPKLRKSTAIFILPPSLESLWQRLEGRGTDSAMQRWTRLLNAKEEIEKADHYDRFIVNDDLEHAYTLLKDIIVEGKDSGFGPKEGHALCAKLLDEFEHSTWLKDLRETFGNDAS